MEHDIINEDPIIGTDFKHIVYNTDPSLNLKDGGF